VFADSIYNRLAAWLACYLAGLVLIIVRRPAGTTGFVVQPRRWVVERSLGWFGRWRRLSKDYEALPEVAETMVTLAAIRLMLHRRAHPNRRRLPPHNFQNGLSATSVTFGAWAASPISGWEVRNGSVRRRSQEHAERRRCADGGLLLAAGIGVGRNL
jgi:Transposase DDE domain